MAWYNPLSWGDESSSQIKQRSDMIKQGQAASAFAQGGEAGFGALGAEGSALRGESAGLREALRRRAAGEGLLSTEQLRQGLGQQLAQQRSMAASASPANSAMAARNAAINMGRASSAMSGQAAMAGLAERAQAEQALGQQIGMAGDMIGQARQQDLMAALQSRQNAMQGYSGYKPEGSALEKWSGPISAGLSAGAQFGLKRSGRSERPERLTE